MISLKFSFPKAFYRFALFFLYSFPFISLIPAYRRFLQQMPIYTSIYFCMYTFYIYVEVWKEAFHFWDYRSCASFPERDENAGRQTASQTLFESLASLFPFLLSSRMQFSRFRTGRDKRENISFSSAPLVQRQWRWEYDERGWWRDSTLSHERPVKKDRKRRTGSANEKEKKRKRLNHVLWKNTRRKRERLLRKMDRIFFRKNPNEKCTKSSNTRKGKITRSSINIEL